MLVSGLFSVPEGWNNSVGSVLGLLSCVMWCCWFDPSLIFR